MECQICIDDRNGLCLRFEALLAVKLKIINKTSLKRDARVKLVYELIFFLHNSDSSKLLS